MEGITYKAGPDCGPAAGKIFTGGRPAEINGKKVVRFPAPLIQGGEMAIKYDCRPDLAALVIEYQAKEAAEAAERETLIAAQRAAQDASDFPLIAAMDAKADALRATIPAGSIAVECRQCGNLDGDPIYRYTADGTDVSWRDVVILGRPCAVRPGALGAFAERCVAYITPAKLVEVRTSAKLAVVRASIARTAARKAQERAEDAASPPTAHPCPYCGTYCCGDCGGKPGDQTEDDRAMRTAMSEANYGVND